MRIQTMGARIPSGKAGIPLINPCKLKVKAPVLCLLGDSERKTFLCRFCLHARASKESCAPEP